MSVSPSVDQIPELGTVAFGSAVSSTVLDDLRAHADDTERAKIRRRLPDPDIPVIGVRMGTVFDLARTHTALPLTEVDRLLGHDEYEARMLAVAVLDFKSRDRHIDDTGRRELYELWMRRIDRMGIWDLIDRSAPRVLGLYLLDKARDPLFELAAAPDVWHRRTAVVATFTIIRAGDIDDPLRLCTGLAGDPEKFVQTALGTALREIGRVDPVRLTTFLAGPGSRLSAAARRVARTALTG
ncbi:MAG TPA: DNA alkylation repair protein [Nakamurella sp.]